MKTILTFGAVLVLATGCKTTERVSRVDKNKGEVVVFSTDDKRSVIAEGANSRVYENVGEKLEAKIKESPRDVQSHLALASLLLAQNKLDEAEVHCKTALRYDLKNVDAKKIFAQIAFRRGNYDLTGIVLSSIETAVSKDSQMLNLLALNFV